MASLLSVFWTAILPVVAIAAIGFVLGRRKDVDPEPLNTTVVYVLAPALVLHSLAVTELAAGTLLRLVVGIGIFVAAMVALSEAVGRASGTDEPLLSALVLAATFTNAGNLGVPVSDFAFGDVGRQTAVLYLSVQSVLMYTIGVYVASRGGGASGLAGLKRVVRIPLVHAVLLALVARWLGIVPPAGSAGMEALALLGNAAIPVMLLILGVQLARTNYGPALSHASTPLLLRMGVAPIVGLAIAMALGFDEPTVARVFVLECSMPVAVTPVILVAEFAGDRRIESLGVPEYMSTVVLVTTIVSVPLLTGIIVLLQTGIVI